jgi:hypothetical protein
MIPSPKSDRRAAMPETSMFSTPDFLAPAIAAVRTRPPGNASASTGLLFGAGRTLFLNGNRDGGMIVTMGVYPHADERCLSATAAGFLPRITSDYATSD